MSTFIFGKIQNCSINHSCAKIFKKNVVFSYSSIEKDIKACYNSLIPITHIKTTKHLGLEKMTKRNLRVVFLGLCCYCVATTIFAEEANNVVSSNATLTPTITNGELPLRTEEDRKRGKENINTVIDELQELFSKNSYQDIKNVTMKPIAPAYSQIIQGPKGTATLVYRARFTTASKIYKAIDGLATSDATLESIPERNTVVVTDKADNIEYYKKLIEAIDIPSSQILIEAKVVEVLFNDGMQRNLSVAFNDNSGAKVGTTTTAPGAKTTDNGLSGSFKPGNFDISFKWLLTAQDAKVISSPNILVTRNEVARIVTAEEIPIQDANTVNNSISFKTTFKRVGVTLEVEPQMINDDNVTLRLFPQVSNVLRYEQFPVGGLEDKTYPVPVVSVRSVESYLRMQNQQVVMLGGLYSSRDILQQERTPVLSDIPIIGELFTGKNKSREVVQLIFFIKLHIIPAEAVANGFLYDPNALAIESEQLGNIIDNPTVIPQHEKGVSGLFEEMNSSLSVPWIPNKTVDKELNTEIVDTPVAPQATPVETPEKPANTTSEPPKTPAPVTSSEAPQAI